MSTTDIVLVAIIVISSTCFGYTLGTKVGYREAINLLLRVSLAAANNTKIKEERKDND